MIEIKKISITGDDESGFFARRERDEIVVVQVTAHGGDVGRIADERSLVLKERDERVHFLGRHHGTKASSVQDLRELFEQQRADHQLEPSMFSPQVEQASRNSVGNDCGYEGVRIEDDPHLSRAPRATPPPHRCQFILRQRTCCVVIQVGALSDAIQQGRDLGVVELPGRLLGNAEGGTNLRP